MRIVLDVNILASASLKLNGVPAELLRWASDESQELIVSEGMIKALGDVLTHPYFAARLTVEERKEFVESVRDIATFQTPDPSVTGVADDAEDDRVLGTAVAGRADIIVTGDNGMLAIGSFVGIPIVTARTFLNLIDS